MRGEIWTVAGGAYASKPRPALVIQDDRFDANDSLTVLPLTSTLVDIPLLRIPVKPSELSGLVHESHIMIDKLTTVRRTNVHARVGRLAPVQMVEVERALLVFLGVA
ncbi:type II toxin-antitoxin system PemK/MazF family toxin [Paenarthrobacter sp. NPDC018779]|uniref:type II toxin-antitoxin system PemK/MazF family toxin n=1 Tax=Paenarthrobacter sp. NPDC018779 TaxID=3364375 RepID=UPI0037C856B2